jgi:DNA-binding transcriptional ArsR family regulator
MVRLHFLLFAALSAPRTGEGKNAMTDSQAHLVFAALADPTRRLLFQQLCEEGSGTATSFAARLPMTRQAVTKHLATLAEAGLVTVHETGRERRYVPQPESLQAVTTWIAEVESRWDTRLAALRRYLLDKPKQDPS